MSEFGLALFVLDAQPQDNADQHHHMLVEIHINWLVGVCCIPYAEFACSLGGTGVSAKTPNRPLIQKTRKYADEPGLYENSGFFISPARVT